MASSLFLYFKVPETDQVIQVDVTAMLIGGETITNAVIGAVQPTTTPAFTATLQTPTVPPIDPQLQVLLQGGENGVSYGFNITITTTARVFLVTAGVTCQDPSFVPYTTKNPTAFTDLIGQIEAGNAAIGTAVFSFPAAVNPGGGFVTWELLASDGTVFSAGNAFQYTVTQNGFANVAVAKSVISVPSTTPPSLDNQAYQLRYTLELPQAIGTPSDPLTGNVSQNVFFQFENIKVVGATTVPLGVQPSVELQGVPATVALVVSQPWDNVTVELWAGATQIAPASAIQEYETVANGYVYAGVLDTSQLGVSLVPYQIIWKYWASTNAAVIMQESADMFITNPSIMGAVHDLKSKINKARTTLYGRPDLLYPVPTCLTWLRRGGDAFNIAYGQFTNFTFTNALGGIREFWLLEAEMAAIQSQYLAEGEKAFNYQGAQISLEVDRTQYLEAAANAIQSRFDQELKLIKTNLIIKGVTSGDGSTPATALQPGAIGAVGITITPASMFGRYSFAYGTAGQRIF
jgi:hypothetical protein